MDNATSSFFSNKDINKVTRVTNKSFAAIENYMNNNRLKLNADKAHLMLIAKSSGREVRGRQAAEQRAAVNLTTGGEMIRHSDWELVLGATVHHYGTWTAMIRAARPPSRHS